MRERERERETTGIRLPVTLILKLFVGFQSGKTVLANFLSDTIENVGGEYRPTKGVRYG